MFEQGTKKRPRRSLGMLAGPGLLLGLTAGCGAYDPDAMELVGTEVQARICGDDDLQPVEQYVNREGVPFEFVDRHQKPVGDYGCTGTLIGDGLMITAAHCVSNGTVGRSVRFNYQVDAEGTPYEPERFRVAQVVEDNPGGVTTDHALLRLFHNPEERFGFTPISGTGPVAGAKLVAIGHSARPGPNYKVVDVGTAHTVTATNIRYKSVDTEGNGSGQGLLGYPSGRLVGVHRASTGCSGDVANNGNPIERIFGVSEYVQRGTASARLYSPSNSGLTTHHWTRTNWPSSYLHIVPGVFKPWVATAPLQQLFFYDSETGTAEFNEISKTAAAARLGPLHTGLRRTLTQIVPVQIDSTPQQELLFYDAHAGLGSFYRTDGAGSLSLIRNISGWGRNWRHIVAGEFTSRTGQELLFYDPVDGLMRLYGTNSNGTISLIRIIPDVSPDYSIIVPGEFSSASPNVEVMMYNPVSDYITFLRFDDSGNATEFGRQSLGSSMFTQIALGDFTSSPGAELLFFEPSPVDVYADSLVPTGTAYYYSVTNGVLTPRLVEQGYRRAHSRIIAGSFTSRFVPACTGCSFGTQQAETSVLFYDRYRN